MKRSKKNLRNIRASQNLKTINSFHDCGLKMILLSFILLNKKIISFFVALKAYSLDRNAIFVDIINPS